jgi:hypothetical protein
VIGWRSSKLFRDWLATQETFSPANQVAEFLLSLTRRENPADL